MYSIIILTSVLFIDSGFISTIYAYWGIGAIWILGNFPGFGSINPLVYSKISCLFSIIAMI